MKTVLWATLTANGNYAQSSPDNPPKKEALGDFAAYAQSAGNFIVGRRTFEAMQANAAGGQGPGPFADLDIVVVSKSAGEMPGATVAGSPQEALDYLQSRGHETALIAAGADLHNAFLCAGLIDEAVFNIAPVVEGKGLNLLIDTEHYRYKHVELIDHKSLGGGVIQLRYSLGRS